MSVVAEATAGRAELHAVLDELEGRPLAAFRSLLEPAVEAERRAAELGDEEAGARARLLQAGVFIREGRDEGGRLAHRVHAWAQQHDNAYVLARAHRQLSIFYRQLGDVSEGLTHAVQGVAHLRDDEPPAIRARHLMTLAVALDESGSMDEGDVRFREALDIAAGIGDHEATLNILNNMAYTAFERQDEPGARQLVAQMIDARDRSGRSFSAIELDTVARIEMMGGRYDAVEQTLGVLGQQGYSGDEYAVCMLTLAEARRMNGRFAEAQTALDAARRMCKDRGLNRVHTQVQQEQAALFAATGRFREAYEEHRAFHAASSALFSAQRDARARALQAVFEATEARRATEHFREMAHRDALTGLWNRRYVNDRLPALLGEAAVRRGPISLALIDLDHFKRVNDTLSHSTGDTVLQQIAHLLIEAATGPAVAARMGGEEFLLIFPDVDAAEAARRCERLRQRIQQHDWAPVTGTLPVTTSIGVTTAEHGTDVASALITPSALLSQADRNLYAAKRGGRNRVVTDLPA